MKKIILLIILSFVIDSSFGCLSANQNRLFPIGICSKGLVVVEVHMFRSEIIEKGEDLKPVWSGLSYMNIYDNNHKRIESILLDTIKTFPDRKYVEILQSTFNKGFEEAKKLQNLITVEPDYLSFCDYQSNCKKASLRKDTIRNKAFILLHSKAEREINILNDSTSIASNYLSYYNGFNYDSTESKMKYIIQSLEINSIRKYKIGNKTLTIIHLGSGQLFEFEEKSKEYKPNFEFSRIENSVFVEPVLHHGHGFDFFIME